MNATISNKYGKILITLNAPSPKPSATISGIRKIKAQSSNEKERANVIFRDI